MNKYKINNWTDLDQMTMLNPALLLDVDLIAPEFLEELRFVVSSLCEKHNTTSSLVCFTAQEYNFIELFSRFIDSKYKFINVYSEQSVITYSDEIKTELEIISMLYYLRLKKVI